jgi:hypothetical protein
MIAATILLRWSVARDLRAKGQPTQLAWQGLWSSPLIWMGAILIVGFVSPAAGGVLIGTLIAIYLVFFAVLFARGIRGLPAFWRRVRRIGEPDAWRGN